MWDTVFGTANVLAMVMWAALILLPRWPALLAGVLYAGVGLLCLAYSVGLIGILTGTFDAVGGEAPASFSSIEGVRGIFASDGGTTIGWIHYLAFDMFAGLWIARDADAKGFSRLLQAPILFATFMAGPLGLFLWLVIRERARAGGWPLGIALAESGCASQPLCHDALQLLKTAERIHGGLPKATFDELITHWAQEKPHQTALEQDGEAISFADLGGTLAPDRGASPRARRGKR